MTTLDLTKAMIVSQNLFELAIKAGDWTWHELWNLLLINVKNKSFLPLWKLFFLKKGPLYTLTGKTLHLCSSERS